MDLKLIENVDPDIAGAIAMEFDRQKNTLELIASENIASPAVMAVQASVLFPFLACPRQVLDLLFSF